MKKHTLAALMVVGLTACGGQPYEDVDIDNILDDDLLSKKQPIQWGFSKKQRPQSEETPTSLNIAPIERPEGAMTFDAWKRAKAANHQEYRDFVEYREYLHFLQEQKNNQQP